MAVLQESILSWKRLFFCTFALLVVTFLFNAGSGTTTKNISNVSNSKLAGFAALESEAVDGLTEDQCKAYFPDILTVLDASVTHWKHELQHTIVSDDIVTSPVDATLRFLIHENQLRVLSSAHAVDRLKASPDRGLGVVYLLQRALDSASAAGEKLPTVEVSFNLRDDAEVSEESGDTHSYWSFARTISKPSHQRLWMFPNFDFWYYAPTGSFADSKRNAMQQDAPFTSKIPKIVWRGNAGFNPDVRGALLEATKGKEWADVKEVHFDEDPPVAMDVDKFCRYAMTVYTEGVTYSGRLKFLMNCQSLLFVHEPEYNTHYSHLLVSEGSDQNCVSVKRDWSDLEEKVKYYLAHPAEAEKIVANSLATFRSRYTTRAATSCYIRHLIKSYASVAFTPEVSVLAKDGLGTKYRGVSFEEFMDRPQDIDYEIVSTR